MKVGWTRCSSATVSNNSADQVTQRHPRIEHPHASFFSNRLDSGAIRCKASSIFSGENFRIASFIDKPGPLAEVDLLVVIRDHFRPADLLRNVRSAFPPSDPCRSV